jgi:glutamate--cysteine ligase
MSDWANHLTTLFPDVRLKRYLEMRGADCGPEPFICALPALWVGLLYDANCQAEAAAYVSDWTQEERDSLRAQVRACSC